MLNLPSLFDGTRAAILLPVGGASAIQRPGSCFAHHFSPISSAPAWKELSRLLRNLSLEEVVVKRGLRIRGDSLVNRTAVLARIEQAARERATKLDLSGEGLESLPSEIGNLTNLTSLDLSDNRLTSLPLEIGRLANLRRLDLNYAGLTSLPSSIGALTRLEHLDLGDNDLESLPPEIGGLGRLAYLELVGNHLACLPAEMGDLASLEEVNLSYNPLRSLPPEMGQLVQVHIQLEGTPLASPPPEVIEQGTQAILAYLREQLREGVRQWVSKLLLVGEGAVGKTQLLRSLRGEAYDPQLPTTHGIEIGAVELQHPQYADVTMRLNSWDFGGQEIYHATHQFFLTNRSLFLLVWNARQGFEQGKLYYWLDTIRARAPESPVLIVATHIDERDADIPFGDLRAKYPQIVAHCEVSNLDGRGMEDLRREMARAAAALPLMGETWPATWLKAAEAIRSSDERYVTPGRLWEIMARHDVTEDGYSVLVRWLHELGDILYFQDDEELKDTVILKPEWVTEYFSKALESEKVIDGLGIFTREHMDELWRDIEPSMRDHFLRLMERFDLSYRIPSDEHDRSLIVERLSFDPPDYVDAWENMKTRDSCTEITMRFDLNTTMPAGIPTWFIARSHRFTTYTHWRYGALFADGPERRHLGLIQAFPHDRYLQLTVRGPCPQNFFALLRDGLELTLERFPGLKIERLVPCPGHDGNECPFEFNLAHLERAISSKPPVLEIQCQERFKSVAVPLLLFGVDWPMEPVPSPPHAGFDAVLARLDRMEDRLVKGQEVVVGELSDLRELAQREFTNIFRREQANVDSCCPNVFVLRPVDSKGWRKKLVGQKMELQLFCQAPGCWHPTKAGGRYTVVLSARWLTAMAPYIRKLVSVMKYAAPVVGPWIGMADADFREMFKGRLDMMKELVGLLPDIEDRIESRLSDALHETEHADRATGAALRALRVLLDKKDPSRHWGRLKKVLTPEGHILWLCHFHAKQYAR